MSDQKIKCVADYLKVTEDTATASIKSTADNYLGRLLQIGDVEASITRLEGEHGKNIVEYALHNKTGWDVSAKKEHKVNYIYVDASFKNNIYDILTLCFG